MSLGWRIRYNARMADKQRSDAGTIDIGLPSPGPLRTGDDVTWYDGKLRGSGPLLGIRPDGSVRVRYDAFGLEKEFSTIAKLRRSVPVPSAPPAWDRLPPDAALAKPTEFEHRAFDELLEQVVPPGPSVRQFVDEVWARGYEVLFSGGVVRDVLNERTPRDINLVTTMPLADVSDLLSAMYGPDQVAPSGSRLREVAFVSPSHLLQVTVSSSDWFVGHPISVRNICLGAFDEPNGLFGNDLSRHCLNTDFTCNCAYYQPQANVLIDPTGVSLAHIDSRTLALAHDHSDRPAAFWGWLSVRSWRFLVDGYTASPELQREFSQRLTGGILAMGRPAFIGALKREVLQQLPYDARQHRLGVVELLLDEWGLSIVWTEHIAPSINLILGDVDDG